MRSLYELGAWATDKWFTRKQVAIVCICICISIYFLLPGRVRADKWGRFTSRKRERRTNRALGNRLPLFAFAFTFPFILYTPAASATDKLSYRFAGFISWFSEAIWFVRRSRFRLVFIVESVSFRRFYSWFSEAIWFVRRLHFRLVKSKNGPRLQLLVRQHGPYSVAQ